jgi:hypothetical protein
MFRAWKLFYMEVIYIDIAFKIKISVSEIVESEFVYGDS